MANYPQPEDRCIECGQGFSGPLPLPIKVGGFWYHQDCLIALSRKQKRMQWCDTGAETVTDNKTQEYKQ